ncbi:hypothetical protein PybrP1_001560, partial [[Pythium] brassicae (nom. inval.)]
TKIFAEEQRLNALVAGERQELHRQGLHLNALQQQVPEVVVEIDVVKSSKSALEFLVEGCFIEVEYDDESWYQCQVLRVDPYDTLTADVLYVDDERRETIRLVEASALDQKRFQRAAPSKPKAKSVAEITAAAAVLAQAQEVPFRRWRAGCAVDISWEPPLDNGAAISGYVIEWQDDADESVAGKKIVSCTLRVRIAAENKKGVGLASVFTALPADLADVSYLTAEPLTCPLVDTSRLERDERSTMEAEDRYSLEHRWRLTCTICLESQLSERSALRYHMWHCSIPKPMPEEQQSELFMEIFNISRQYCLRKPRRHTLSPQSTLNSEDGVDPATAEAVFLESKYQGARVAWFAKAREIHETNLKANAAARRRERENRYEPPCELFGVDFASPELNVARRNAVLTAIGILRSDLDAYVLETNTQMGGLKLEEKELLDYVALKVKRMKTSKEEWQRQSLQREKKKATKSLGVVQEKVATLTAESTQRIEDMTAEISRLTTIEKAFVPFTHQVIKMMRLSALVSETHAKSNAILKSHRVILTYFQEKLRKLQIRAQLEVDALEAWDAMVEARRKQLQALKDELRRLQLMHLAEMQSYKQKRDEGDEMFELKKLREQQIRIVTRQERAAQALLASRKQTRVQEAEEAVGSAASGDGDNGASFELTTTVKSLAIVNHDLVLHERFVKGKSADAEYLQDAEVGAGNARGGNNNRKLAEKGKGIHHIRGTVVHAPSLGHLALFPDAVVTFDRVSGRIVSFDSAAGTSHDELPPTSVTRLSQHQMLLPGFVDTHVHAPQFMFAGTATDAPLMQWLDKYTFPVEAAFADLAVAREWYTKLLDRLLREGVTTAQYFATTHVAATKLLADLVEARGQRGFVGLVSMDRNAPADYKSPSAQHALADAEEFVQYALAKQSALVVPVLTPRFVPTCSPELLRGLGALAAKYGGLHIQSHAAESRDEEAFVEQLHPGRRDTALFQDAQLLTPRTCMAHAVHLTDDEVAVFQRTGTSIAHCPLSNFYFANGFLDVDRMLASGVAVGLGTDIAGGYSPSMLRAIQTSVLTAKALEIRDAAAESARPRRQFDYKDAFWLATMGGATALGLENVTGSFEVGKYFDAIVADVSRGGTLDIAGRDSATDVFQKLIHNGDNRNFVQVFVNGRVVHHES